MNPELLDEAEGYEDALHDIYAGLAMVAMLKGPEPRSTVEVSFLAFAAFDFADAMMSERKARAERKAQSQAGQ
jgi:hypothetical protein